MTPPAVGSGTLRRLSAIGEAGQPVVSVYLSLDPVRFPTLAARETQLDALVAQSRRDGAGADAAQVRELLRREPAMLHGERGLAVFSCAAAGTLEAIPLPVPVEPLAVVDSVPWLEPLVAMLTAENWGVAVVGRRGARLLRGGRRGLVEFVRVDDEVHGRHAQGGWSQARWQRGVEQEVAWHVGHVAEQLLRADRRRPFDHLVVVAGPELWPAIEASLSAELRERLAGHVAHDLEHASADEILDAISPVVETAQQLREHELLGRLGDALGERGRAAAGLDEVLGVLDEERVAVLLVAEGAELAAWRCPRCGRLSATASRRCEHDDPLTRVDAVEHLVERATRTGVDLLVVHHELEALHARGSVAALLRW